MRDECVDVVLHDRIDQVAAGSGAALTRGGQIVERYVVSCVRIDELFAASGVAVAAGVIGAAKLPVRSAGLKTVKTGEVWPSRLRQP